MLLECATRLLCLCNKFILDGQFLSSYGSMACLPHKKHYIYDFKRSLLDNSPSFLLFSKVSNQMFVQPNEATFTCDHEQCLPISDRLQKSALKTDVWANKQLAQMDLLGMSTPLSKKSPH